MPDPLEVWKDVPGFQGKYQVSDQGRIRSCASPNGRGDWLEVPRLMKPTPNYSGYRVVTLSMPDGRRVQKRLHCLVLEAFVGPRPEGLQAAHCDDDKSNNRLSNLKWKTLGENMRDRNLNGRTARGVRSGAFKHGKFVGTNRRYYPPKYVADL